MCSAPAATPVRRTETTKQTISILRLRRNIVARPPLCRKRSAPLEHCQFFHFTRYSPIRLPSRGLVNVRGLPPSISPLLHRPSLSEDAFISLTPPVASKLKLARGKNLSPAAAKLRLLKRLRCSLKFEKQAWDGGAQLVAGVDEVGRGKAAVHCCHKRHRRG